jgi:hypothetical protein
LANFWPFFKPREAIIFTYEQFYLIVHTYTFIPKSMGNFWNALEWNMLVYLIAIFIWILLSSGKFYVRFGIFCWQLVYFVVNRYILLSNPLGVKFSVRPSILLNSRECSPLGWTKGWTFPLGDKFNPRGPSSPQGVKFTLGGQGEANNSPQGCGFFQKVKKTIRALRSQRLDKMQRYTKHWLLPKNLIKFCQRHRIKIIQHLVRT